MANPAKEIRFQVIWSNLISIVEEQARTLMRTAFSPVVRDSGDLSAALFDRQGRMLAQAQTGTPGHVNSTAAAVPLMLEEIPIDQLEEGDHLITNDPWLGTGHMFDINVMRPVFHDGSIVAYVISITHLPDIGGLGFGAAAREIYHEGLRLPVCKLFEAGVQNDFIVELVRSNVRAPEQVIGDLMANVTATTVGEGMLTGFLAEYGLADFADLSGEIRGRSEAATRARISEMADGSYKNQIQIEGVDGALTLACRIDIDGDSMTVDFSGTAPSVRRGINVPFCYTRAMVLYSMKCLTVPELPNNGGSVVPITVTAPTGCLLDARPPSPTGARHMIGPCVAPLVFGALAAAVPDSIQADCGMLDLMTFQGRHRDGHDVSTIYFASGGFGALAGLDGAETTPGPSNMAVVPVEVWETLTSTTVERKELLPDSGGAGAWRGGLGQEVVIRNDSGHIMTVFCMANRTEFPPLGLMGGANGRARQHRVNDVTVDPKGHYELAPGDRITMIEAGGAGYGDPGERAPDAIKADLEEGFVTPEGAARDYDFSGG
ncbi:MAG: hydantoinase B/oxoprolinase family protein [Alphaproteobacteria bacterium]|nr:hydantoinase B/oxoprolinase family protein [Alphaproteobacteria bacterium]